MRLSSAQIFNQSITSVLQKQTATSKILEQLSSGKKVNTAGDDPVAALGIDNLNQRNALVDQFMKNIDYATNRLAVTESKLGSAENLASSIREQVMRAVNGTLADSERQMIADEMKGSLEELLSIANSKDESGNYMFSGYSTDKEPFAFDNSTPPKIVYSGDSGIRNSLVQSGVALGTNVPGDTAFMKAPNGLGDYSVNYLASQQGEFSVKTAKIADPATYLADTYTFNFSDNGSGGTNLQVLDSANNPVANIANFDAATPVSFNGIEVNISGKPSAGDSFTMEPQSEVSIFDTISRAIALIEDPNSANTPQGRSQLAQILNDIDSGVNQISSARSVAGNNLKAVESYKDTHIEEQVLNTSALSLLEDLDYASAITEFAKQQLALNAVSSVFSKVGSVSLFDYI
ncbi:flagellar hook-associated protein FlgL [Shewanella xiamenensis]|uniref:flagellar hook-associated protein FlgL n=1 Tax=Shewanella TaxID=22 RepID=UPI00005DD3EA|nr:MULTISPECIES: flagellar hook-associated protein FlgL [Shewanella]QXN23838.1 flagellar hook-associated protein FlgL [Shewanella putrefaciens]ABK47565.1 flagellar hook-associated protein 3 [Shewanella sp. ANA-3]ASF13622.1 flagellar hook-associated protein 3 [Shewanella sp. FDAARGOS_354]MDH0447882.1 flagellar hook-associated protein FlgL [Shewanella sp. GD04112]MDH1314255.1 flagellar hook-associated protein FlgL [Shewanella xiamenensis]